MKVSDIPASTVITIIQLVVDIANGNKSPQEVAKEYALPLSALMKVLVNSKTEAWAAAGLSAAGLKKLSEKEFSKQLLFCMQSISVLVRKFVTKQIDEGEFIVGLGNSEMREIAMKLLDAVGVSEKLGVKNMKDAINLAPWLMAVMAFTAAYKELRKAYDDLSVAHEKRIEIEAACNQSIERICKYRVNLEQIVSEYLTEHLETINAGLAAMDKAIIDEDVDGYIQGNVEIQKILKYDVQFTNQKEFDDLMLSESAFKL